MTTAVKHCVAITKSGKPCRNTGLDSNGYCNAHNGTLDPAVGGRARQEAARKLKEAAQTLAIETAANAILGLDARLRIEAGKREQELVEALVNSALAGKTGRLEYLFDRLEGRPTARVEHTVDDGLAALEALSTRELARRVKGFDLELPASLVTDEDTAEPASPGPPTPPESSATTGPF